MDPPRSILSDQARQNRDTSQSWMLYQSHRRELERLLVPDHPGKTLCVLGAGNCNDLDLTILLEAYTQVHLVDWDRSALQKAVDRQGVASSPRLHLHGPVDLTAVAAHVEAWNRSPTPPQIRHCIQEMQRAELPALGPFDVVVSACLLSQLINPARKVIGASHPIFTALATAYRRRHLHLMTHCLKAGGRGILAIDLVSSDRFPRLVKVQPDELPQLAAKLLADQIHYPGLDPDSFRVSLREIGIDRIQTTTPWIWRLSLQRSFLVYGLTFQTPAASIT